MVGEYKNQLTVGQRLDLVRLFGNKFNCNYDFNRPHALWKPGSVAVDTNQIFQAAFGSTTSMQPCNGKPLISAGQCHDIASVQGQLLEALGFRDAYVISFVVSGGNHVVPVVRDPATNTIYGLNYSSLYVIEGRQGGAALYQGRYTHENNLVYRVFEPGGRMVDVVASEAYKP